MNFKISKASSQAYWSQKTCLCYIFWIEITDTDAIYEQPLFDHDVITDATTLKVTYPDFDNHMC